MTYNGQTFDVQIEAGIHSATGQVFANFYSVDPNTSLPPSNVLTGFLPPEDGTGRGQGYITYSVAPKASAATGVVIPNVAYVTFDAGQSIATNQVSETNPAAGTDPNKEARVTIDANIPVAHIAAMPGNVAPIFNVFWSGDTGAGGSGIASYTVYVSTDGGATYLPWLVNTTATSATYYGAVGINYSFYVVATSHVGNVQVNAQASAVGATATNMAAIEYWRLLNYNITTNTGVAADDAEPDNDGLVNLLKYGLVLPTGAAGNEFLPASQLVNYADGARLTLGFYRDPSHNDVTLEVQAAGTPNGPWTTVATSTGGGAFAGPGFVGESTTQSAFKAVQVRDTVNYNGTAQRYLRVTVGH
jgi:hypothetical protein